MFYPTAALALFAAWILNSAFLAVLFLQSGIDKVIDRRGNLEFLASHFAKSPLAKMVPLLVTVVTLIELIAGSLSAIGCLLILSGNGPACAFYGALVAAVAILALFFGQRMAKDYAGAAVLVPYFLLALLGMFLFTR